MDYPDVNKIAADTATNILTTMFGNTGVALGWIKDKAKAHDIFGKLAEKYANKFIERNNRLNIIGKTEPISLEGIFVRVNILKEVMAWKNRSPEEIKLLEDEFRRRSASQYETENIDGIELINKVQHCILLGHPGGGKTTFLKYVGIQSLKGALEKDCIPVFIPLRELADKTQTLMEYIEEEFKICNLTDAKSFIEYNLQNGNFLFLLDGLDEVGINASKVISEKMAKFLDKYSNNRFIISCRTAAYKQNFPWTVVEIAKFNNEQINNFIEKWFGNKEDAELCKEKLYLEENKPTLELARTPLLLTMICLVFNDLKNISFNRAELYENALDILMVKWDLSKNVYRGKIYPYLPVKRIRQLYSEVAYNTFKNNTYFIKKRDIEAEISNYISKLLHNLKDVNLDADSVDILETLESHHGIISEQIKNIFSFAHLTFHEYFTANYIVENQKGLIEHLTKQVADPRWREVFLLTIEMLPNADELLKLIKAQIDTIVREKEIKELLSWAIEMAAISSHNYKLSVARSCYLYIAIAVNQNLETRNKFKIDLDHAREHASPHSKYDEARIKGRFDRLELENERALFLSQELAHSLVYDPNLLVEKESKRQKEKERQLAKEFEDAFKKEFEAFKKELEEFLEKEIKNESMEFTASGESKGWYYSSKPARLSLNRLLGADYKLGQVSDLAHMQLSLLMRPVSILSSFDELVPEADKKRSLAFDLSLISISSENIHAFLPFIRALNTVKKSYYKKLAEENRHGNKGIVKKSRPKGRYKKNDLFYDIKAKTKDREIALSKKSMLPNSDDFVEPLYDNDMAIVGKILTKTLTELFAKIPNNKDDNKSWESWYVKLQNTLKVEFGIREDLKLTEKQYKNLNDYLYANMLMVDCFNSFRAVSQGVRDEIFDNLLAFSNT